MADHRRELEDRLADKPSERQRQWRAARDRAVAAVDGIADAAAAVQHAMYDGQLRAEDAAAAQVAAVRATLVSHFDALGSEDA